MSFSQWTNQSSGRVLARPAEATALVRHVKSPFSATRRATAHCGDRCRTSGSCSKAAATSSSTHRFALTKVVARKRARIDQEFAQQPLATWEAMILPATAAPRTRRPTLYFGLRRFAPLWMLLRLTRAKAATARGTPWPGIARPRRIASIVGRFLAPVRSDSHPDPQCARRPALLVRRAISHPSRPPARNSGRREAIPQECLAPEHTSLPLACRRGRRREHDRGENRANKRAGTALPRPCIARLWNITYLIVDQRSFAPHLGALASCRLSCTNRSANHTTPKGNQRKTPCASLREWEKSRQDAGAPR